MKKYTQPELSISMFDIEDVITASGQKMTIADIAIEVGGKLYTDAALTQEATATDAAAYFNWSE